MTASEVAGMSGDAATDIKAIDRFINTVHHMLENERFQALDCLADSLRVSKEMFPGGMWKLHAVYNGLDKPLLHPTEEDWKAHMAMVHKLVASRPKSITARVALAHSYINWAQNARGDGYADTVSESGWKLFEERRREAKRVLDEAAALPSKCPEWYIAMLDLDSDSPARRDLFDRALKFEPAYYYFYRMYANYTLPQWGGEPGEAEKFLQEEADRLGGDAGDIVYFQVATVLACDCSSDNQLNLSWPKIQKGFAALEKRSGAAMENLNLMASMAASFNDPVVANQMFNRIGDQWSETKWQTFARYDSARKWAKSVEPMLARKQAAEASAEANLHTAEGPHYKAAVDETIHSWIQSCLQSLPAGELNDFELLVRVGKDGTIGDIAGGGARTPLTSCLSGKLGVIRQANQAAFPPPPQPDYWVRFDFDSKSPVPVAQK